MAASYISVPRDLTKVKSKLVFGLTKRQLVCFSMAALIGVPSFFLIKHLTGTNTAVMGMIILMMPFFFLAMYEKNGQTLEVIMRHMVQSVFIRPKVRPYKTDNYYEVLIRYARAKEEIEKIEKKAADHMEKKRNRKQEEKKGKKEEEEKRKEEERLV